MLDPGAKMPRFAHPWDGGLDLFSNEDGYIRANHYHIFDTGTHIEIPEGMVGLIRSRSGLMCMNGLVTDGTIDSHYTGPIKVCLFNHGSSSYEVKAGDKIAQLVIVKCEHPTLELVDSLEETDRGDNGFGSTGR
jgi:dUTP pyrophosphatase